jgi:photosystem II stability/assembly factor-like uncharacterized protein
LAVLFLFLLGIYLYPKLQILTSQLAPKPVVFPTDTPALILAPPIASTATATSLPTPTPIPLTWKRVSLGQEFERDTVTAFVIDPKDPEVLYAGMKNAGIFKSIDGGLSWRPAYQGLTNAHVTSLLIDFQNPHILYAGTPGGIFKTEDGGENWDKFAEEIFLLMDSQDSSHLYKRDSNAIYESIDQGKSWQTVYSSKESCPGEILGWDIHPADGNTLFVSGGEFCEPGVYISNDRGHTWTLLAKTEIRPGGYTFHDLGLDTLTIGADRQGNFYIYIRGSNARGIYAGVTHNENGAWRTVLEFERPVPETITFDSTGTIYFHCPPDNLCKFNPDERQKVTLGRPDVSVATNIVISTSDPNTIYVGGKGVSVSRDGGQTWAKLNNGLGTMLVTLETGEGNPPFLYLQGECDTSSFPYLMEKFDYLTNGKGQQEPGQPLFISKDGGQKWDLVSNTGCYLIKDSNGIILYRIARAVGFCEGCENPKGWIWRSQDTGQTWRKMIMAPLIYWESPTLVAHPTQSGILFVVQDVSYAMEPQFISKDYGSTWERQNPPMEVKPCYGSTLQFIDKYRPMAIDPQDGNHVLVIEDGALLESYDSCETTSALGTDPNASMNSIAFDTKNHKTLYAGTNEGAYISFDRGQTWHQINDGLLGATVVYSIVVDNEGNVYAATPYGIFKLENN